MELIDLKAEIRKGSGKIAARALRKNKSVPAVLYGSKIEPQSIAVNTYEFSELIRKNGSSGLFINLNIAGDTKPSRTVLLKEVQMDTFRLNYLHADFQEIDMDEKVSVMVPVEPVGASPGVKAGGLLQVIRRELELWCRPADTPESVSVDVSSLNVGDAVHVEDIDLGSDIEIPHEVNFTVITVVPPVTSGSDSDEEVEEEEEELEA
ncbi:50S ribosomal protein L25 [Desulfamplus magnetovallimortis]|uniref:Large ribosomal subunit protein bL25 n=1 Tax=Desulfamplus magnetovallimortis TaxID=1246637 RepID=A0A1W1H9B8_9BACT|nr:50S ribosomal protein L25 [Desulfamplus magnetovallimortis]SLM29036.1 50S ribosomal protein L25 [Desulfamplus magnetovallimortis]